MSDRDNLGNFNNHYEESVKTDVSIGICGVGGGGGNAVKSIMESIEQNKTEFNIGQNDLSQIKFIAANTDAQALAHNPAKYKIQLGASLTKGFGAGGSPLIGEKSAIESRDEIIKYLANNDLTFITCGMGGGTGTGAAPVIAQYLQEMREEIVKQYGEHNEFANYLKVAVVTTPFHFEGQKKMQIAKKGIEEMKKYVDTLIVVPNQNLFRIANEKTTFRESFLKADEVLCNAIKCISGLITNAGLINVDFADVRYVLSKKGKAVIGIGNSAGGDDRAIEAAINAMSNPILDQVSFKKAKAVLVNITGGDDLTLYECDAALNRISEEVDADANIIFGSVYDPVQTGKITISVVATGIEDENDEINSKKLEQNRGSFENSDVYNYSQNVSQKKIFGMFGVDKRSENNHSSMDNNLNNAHDNEIHQKNFYEQNNYNKINQSNFTNSSEIKNNENYNQKKEIDLVLNEKLQKLGVYNNLNNKNNFSEDSTAQQAQYLNFKQEKKFEYNEKNDEQNKYNSMQSQNHDRNNHFNNNQEFVENNKSFNFNRENIDENYYQQKDNSRENLVEKKQSNSMFSRFISDIPAYLRKKNKD